MFVWFEVLFFFGWRKEFKVELDIIIEKRIADMDGKGMQEPLAGGTQA